MKTKIFPLLALMLFMGAFFFPVSAYAAEPDSVAPPSVTAVIDGDDLRIETTAGYYGIEAVYINETRFNYRVDGVLSVDAQFYCGDSETVTVYAVDFDGNKSNKVTLNNPYYIKEETPKETNPFTPDGQASVVDTATEGDGKTFYTFSTPDDNIFYLVIDHERDTDNVYFLNAVTESDLLALAAKPSEETVIPTPTPTPPPVTASPDGDGEGEEPAEPEQPAKKGGNGTLIFVLLGVAAVGGAGYYFKIVKPKQQAPAYGDEDDYGEEPEDDGKEIEFEDEPEEETEDEPPGESREVQGDEDDPDNDDPDREDG